MPPIEAFAPLALSAIGAAKIEPKHESEVVAKAEIEATPRLPTFEPRWWYRADRLDARPVIWSLKNRPEEWTVNYGGRPHYYLKHDPSNHVFYVGPDCPAYLYDAPGLAEARPCGCQTNSDRGRLQRFQSFRLKLAAWDWEREYYRRSQVDHAHFAAHFVR